MKSVLCLFVAAVMLIACGNPSPGGQEGDVKRGDTIAMAYAKNIVMVKYDDHTEVTLKDPWHDGKTLHSYILIPTVPEASHKGGGLEGWGGKKASPSGGGLEGALALPVTRSVVFTAAHCQLLQWLGAGEAVTGVCDRKYIHPSLLSALRSPSDCGNGMSPDIEKIISLHPQALIVSPFENSGGYGALEKTDIPIIETAEYMEPTALGRAEWMKFYGLLYGREHEADSLFHVVDSTYHALRVIAQKTTTRPVILTERKTGAVWYVPGGRSSIAQIIADAGGRHPFAEDTHSGSLSLSPEAVLARGDQIDVWAFKGTFHHSPLTTHHSPQEGWSGKNASPSGGGLEGWGGKKASPSGGGLEGALLAEYHGYKALRAFQNGNIWQCNTLQQPYFEEVTFRPDLLLREFIILLHPELHLGKLRYYTK